MTEEEAARKIETLIEKLSLYQYQYYVTAKPVVSDWEYDSLFDELLRLEELFPVLKREDSPTLRVGSDLNSSLPEVEHTIPVLSLDKAYSSEVVQNWMNRTISNAGQDLSFVVEEKIDGISMVLYYEEGILNRAITRGNGFKGNDVTANIKTIRSIPLRLPEKVNLAVRGEVYLPKKAFLDINKKMETDYANPRNLAAGTIRRIKSSQVASVPLTMFVYEGFFEKAMTSHLEILKKLESYGFRMNKRIGFFNSDASSKPDGLGDFYGGSFKDLPAYIEKETEERLSLPYEIDGIVIKVNEIPVRENLGYTGHHPRWAIAYKFESPEGISVVQAIDVQVGRTGRITPVARIKPVFIGGSTISNVTLHNQDYIDMLELAIGDTVAVSKRGDVIPAVERVVEKNEEGNSLWIIPDKCPSCNEILKKTGAHHFCKNPHCPDQVKQRLSFFAGSGGMDIDNLGPETLNFLLEKNLIEEAADLYTFDWNRLIGFPGFGEKKIKLIQEGLEKSLSNDFRLVLSSLGIPDLGPKVAELLIENGVNNIDLLLEIALKNDIQTLIAIPGIAEKKALTLIEELQNPIILQSIEKLRKAGLSFVAKIVINNEPSIFENQTWCITGSFENFKPRNLAGEQIKLRKGKVTTSVTGKTTHLLAGESAGSKRDKAQELGIKIVSEVEFMELLKNGNKGQD